MKCEDSMEVPAESMLEAYLAKPPAKETHSDILKERLILKYKNKREMEKSGGMWWW